MNDSQDNRPHLTYLNEDFLRSPEARHIRILSEIAGPAQRYEREEIKNTIVFFGSARSLPQDEAEANLEAVAELVNRAELQSDELQERYQTAQMDLKLSYYYEAARSLAKKLTEWSNSIVQKEKRFIVCSGGGPGMMEAANRGADEGHGPSIGMNIVLPFEQDPNPYQTGKLSFEFHYFFIRKFWFAYLAKGLVVFPGGFGTMDELFELLTLMQTGKLQKQIPIVLYGKEFWTDFLNFDALLKWQVISKKDLELFKIIDEVDEAFDYIKNFVTEEFL
ncbi:MAG: LOG family protein [bacterium]|nr:LOG family protein [bacterium]